MFLLVVNVNAVQRSMSDEFREFSAHPRHWCGSAPEKQRKYTKRSLAACLTMCRKANKGCACVAFKDSHEEENCKLTGTKDYGGLRASKAGFTAYVRAGAVVPVSTSAAAAAVSSIPAVSSCSADSGLALLSKAAIDVPPFYIHRPAYDEQALASCYSVQHRRAWNFSEDSSALVEATLQRHPARVWLPDTAQVFVTPTFAALSIAAGSCGGVSHYGRMVATTTALRGQTWFNTRPQDLLLLNGVASAQKSPLGELGMLVSSRGGRAACLDPKLCGFFKADRSLTLPWVASSATLQHIAVRTQVDDEACGRRKQGPSSSSRSIPLYFRGALGASKESQDLRVRLLMLRQGIAGAQVTIIGKEQLLPSVQSYLSKNSLKLNRLRRMEDQPYAQQLLKAKFCLCPVGDVTTPGQRLFDAVAAGCVPVLIGVDKTVLPLARQLDYNKFSAQLSRTGFMKDPVYALEGLLHKLESQLPAMQRALADARTRLLYGARNPWGKDDPRANGSTTSLGAFGSMLVREHRLAVLLGQGQGVGGGPI